MLTPALPLLLAACGALLGLSVALICTATGRLPRLRSRVLLVLAGAWVAGTIGLTLGARSFGGRSLNLAPLDVSNRADVVDFVLNVAMFAPAGILLALAGTRLRTAALLGMLASVAIEVTQFAADTGRTADINDVVSNTLGCVAGFVAVGVVRGMLWGREVEGVR